jgi:hypothetical protein
MNIRGVSKRRAATWLLHHAGAIAALANVLGAQAPAPLDTTTLSGDAAAVYRIWRAYLDSKGGRYYAHLRQPSPYWSEVEQRRWPVYDLVSPYLADNATAEVLSLERVRSTVPAADDEFRITTRFRSSDQHPDPRDWRTTMTATVYAVREGDSWRLAGALSRSTRAWRRDTVGPITYVFAQDYPYDRAQARRAVAFTDSLAKAFGVPPLAQITYYLASSADDVYAIMGLESEVKYGATGGLSQPVNQQIFSGIPALGANYRHELAHVVLAPLVSARTSYLISEGVPTWLGGTSGMDYDGAVRGLAALLSERPAVSLDSVISGRLSAAQFYPAAAVLVAMVFERRGVDGLKKLFEGGSDQELRANLSRLLDASWPEVAEAWRARVLDAATRPTPLPLPPD